MVVIVFCFLFYYYCDSKSSFISLRTWKIWFPNLVESVADDDFLEEIWNPSLSSPPII